MISRDDGDGNAAFRELEKRMVGAIDDARIDSAAKEEVTAVNQQIGLGGARIVEYMLKVGKEIGSAPGSIRAGSNRVVEAEVGIGEEDDAYGHLSYCICIQY